MTLVGKPGIQLQQVQKLAEGGKLSRLLHSPSRYIYAMTLLKLIYPFTRKGSLKNAPLFFGGEMKVLLPAATDIYLTGGKTHDSEIRLAKYLIANLNEGDTFLDIGAHFGYFTLMASTLVGTSGKVFSIEPSKGSHSLLMENISANNNISLHHNAVSDVNEEVQFFEFPIMYSEYNALDIEKFKQESWIKKYNPETTIVKAITIDGFLQEQQRQPAIIKIDVEGAEVKVIRGGENTWKTQSPLLVMEYLDEGDESSYTTATALMYNYGYKSYMIGNDGNLLPVDDILKYMRVGNMTSENVVFKKHNK